MKSLYNAYRIYTRQHALYRVTRDEIERLSSAESRDLGIFPEDADLIARRAVWG